MKEIPLTQGKLALVDDEDYERLIKWKWSVLDAGHTFYARRSFYRGPSQNPGARKMEKEILGTNEIIDHIDCNGLNNQRSNLRVANRFENARNKRRSRNNTSGYKGVHFHKKRKKFQAYIGRSPKRFLGRFDSAIEAAIAYDDAALEMYGEFARTNFRSCTPE